MIRLPLIIIGKIIYFISRFLNIGNGGTWPGELALRFKKNILTDFVSQLRQGCILVVGTNGKTTTSLMIKKILELDGQKVLHNESGANLINGIVSTFIKSSSLFGKINADFGVFEVDENSLPLVISNIKDQISKTQIKNKKLVVVFLNLFRDQLDRYGEVDVIAEKWSKALNNMPEATSIILNADDPLIAYLGMSLRTEGEAISNNKDRHVPIKSGLAMTKVVYFGLDDPKLFQKKLEHATDSIFCVNCGYRLSYEGIYYSHIGIWKCEKCGNNRPKPDINVWNSPLPGVYNKYNTLAAVSVVKLLGINDSQINNALSDFVPAFGRQEEFIIKGKKVKIFLAKNPAGFNESLRTVIAMGAKEILFVLNDRIPDGLDVSWIWDVDTEKFLNKSMKIIVSGDRAYDMGLRIKYSNFSKFQISNFKFQIEEDLNKAINVCIMNTPKTEILYILPTYSAMLEVRKIIKGRKIL